jgi:hypothetical protein
MTRTKIVRSGALVALAALTAAGCDRGLTDLNRNPNSPADVSAPLLFSAGIQSVVGRALGSTFFWDYSNSWAQHWAKIQYTTEDRYGLRPAANDAHWTGFYAGGLLDLHRVVLKGDSVGQPGWKAQGLVMQAWTMGIITDTWGDVPFSQAFRGMDALTGTTAATQPRYDTQEDVYRALFADLRAANTILATGPATITAEDLIYQGSAAHWRRFANSLRLRHAMRLSEVDATSSIDAAEEFRVALAAGVFTSNADNAMLRYTSTKPSNNPVNEMFQTRLDHTISKTLVDTMKALSDPRLPVFANLPAIHASADPFDYSLYRGQTNAAARADAPFGQLSMLGDRFLRPDAPAVLMSYSEVLFLRAEAAARGWTTENAAELYYAAIRASMEFYGVDRDLIAAYLLQPRVLYPVAGTFAQQVRQIQLQKWISLFENGSESWAEFRRTGYPELVPGPAPLNAGVLPTRFTYPGVEYAVNSAHAGEAASRLGGGNTMRSRVWWDVRARPGTS